jgi:hypothetical protein
MLIFGSPTRGPGPTLGGGLPRRHHPESHHQRVILCFTRGVTDPLRLGGGVQIGFVLLLQVLTTLTHPRRERSHPIGASGAILSAGECML